MTRENLFDDADREIASDEECEAILAEIKSFKLQYHNPLAQKVRA